MKEIWLDDEQLECEARKRNLKISIVKGILDKRYGLETLLDCLERNEKNGVIYHREGLIGDYDNFDDVEKLIAFIKNGV